MLPVAAVVVGLAALALVARRLLPARRTARVTPPATVAEARVMAPVEELDELLDASRRLTQAATSGDIERAVVREALALVAAHSAAVVRHNGSGLAVGFQSETDLLVEERLDDGAVRRAADTGQPLFQVSATEPSLRNLPAALAAVPLVGGGRVQAVLVLVRTGTQPFTSADQRVLGALAPVAAAALDNAQHARAAIEVSLVDGLTGVGNRRRLDAELPRALEGDRPTSLAIVDLDHFKSVNDTYGHPAGDAVLKGVAGVLRGLIRPMDSLYRFGGEEFCVLLRETETGEAVAIAERMRAAVAARPFSIGQPEPISATASFGVATASSGDDDAAALIARADRALYEAKHNGRNRVASLPGA